MSKVSMVDYTVISFVYTICEMLVSLSIVNEKLDRR